ncbi:MAG: glucosamine-6-phosphate deaminase [Anaerolineae bacterium]|jgi:glucosamine-6-phosphate deaminase
MARVGERPSAEKVVKADALKVEIYANRAELGAAAASDVAERMRRIIAEKGRVVMVFASAPSQDDFTTALAQEPGIDWSKVVAFHLDEYVGLPSDAPQGFGNYIRRHLLDAVKPGTVFFMNGNAPDPEAECRRYSELLEEYPLDIACIGIGENGHIAFNDPHVADFNDPVKVKLVELDERSRVQQVHDGCFATLDAVPKLAITMTIPAIVSADAVHCMVPAATKAAAVRCTVQGPISTECPASILRQHKDATLYVDKDSAAQL